MSGEFTNPAAGGPPYAEPPNTGPPNSEPKKRSLTALWIILAALVGAGAVILFLALSGSGAESDAQGPSDSPTPSAEAPAAEESPTPEPTTEPTTEATTPPASVVFPTDCEQLFDQSMLDEIPRHVLNPPWTEESESAIKHGASDDELKRIIDDNKHITCIFAKETGGGETGITTNVVQVDAETAATVVARLEALDQDCYAELDGLRCVSEVKHEEGMYGYSNFLRDDIWLATGYANMAPEGYTHHIIGNIWG